MIGDDRVLCIRSPATLELYDFAEPERLGLEQTFRRHGDTYPPEADIPIREPIWSRSFSDNWGLYRSPVLRDGATYRLVVSTDGGIWGLVFPATKEGAPILTQLSTFSSGGSVCAPGIRKAFALYGKDETGVRIGYSWVDGDDISASGYINGEPKDVGLISCRHPVFDEEHGRFVYRKKRDVIVVDFTSSNISKAH